MKYGRKGVIQQIQGDKELKEEILTRISETASFEAEFVAPYTGFEETLPRSAEAIDRSSDVDVARRILEAPIEEPTPEDSFTEAIILRLGRPVLKVRNDNFDTAELGTDVWGERLACCRENIVSAILSVGRIEIENHYSYNWVGTGWVVDDEIIVTNRHVADVFARRAGQRFMFRQSFLGTMTARIDFREEHLGGNPLEFPVVEVLYIEPDGGPDLAFLRVAWEDLPEGTLRNPLRLSTVLTPESTLATIGYPAKDTRTKIPQEMDALFGNVYNVKRLAPGKIMQVFDNQQSFAHDCTTLGGNSGSVVLDMETGEALGLHYAGREEYANFAVAAPVVRQRLDSWAGSFTIPVVEPGTTPSEEELDEAPTSESLSDRTGYDPGFLGVEVPYPGLTPELDGQVAPVIDRQDGLLHYTHYSLMIHKVRGFAIYTACNIDGRELRRIPRGNDKWYLDPRMETEYQVSNYLYKSNKLDRGHLVRRIDPTWGSSYEIAKQAEVDTFFYTNCAPQHKDLNREIWLGLEDHILKNTDVHDLKISVFTGPVYRATDQFYRDKQIPEDFWKVVTMVRQDTGSLSATAYLLSQRDFLDDIEFAFGPYQTYQVPVSQIENLTGLDFGELKDFDPLAAIETTTSFRRLDGLDDIYC